MEEVLSSPLSSPPYATPTSHLSTHSSPFNAAATPPSIAKPRYREARALPFELQERVRIFLEEALYGQAITFLLTVLLQGSCPPDDEEPLPAFVPPASQIAFICTLTVHPSLNTRTTKPDKVRASNLALQYLHTLISTVGPVNSKTFQAYSFPQSSLPSRRGVPARTHSPEKYVHDAITSDLAGPASLWARAGDFWAAVGWAFNCSVVHKKRWHRWQLWLEHMLEVLEKDWDLREAENDQKQSLFVEYSSAENDSRRIARSLFADGSKTDLQEFKEVWKNETLEKKREKSWKAEKIKVEKIDIENGEFGDYFNNSSDDEESGDEESDDEMTEADQTPLAQPGSLPDGSQPLGGTEALALRMRLFSLLCKLALALPANFIGINTLFDLCITPVRSQSLLTFTAITSPNAMQALSLQVQSSFMQYLARSLLESAAPPPSLDDLSQDSLEENYLPYAANTNGVAENAKVGACVEFLARMFDRAVGLVWSESLHTAVEEGIKRREEKAKRVGRKKGEAGTASSNVDVAWLKSSGQRLRMLLQVAKINSSE